MFPLPLQQTEKYWTTARIINWAENVVPEPLEVMHEYSSFSSYHTTTISSHSSESGYAKSEVCDKEMLDSVNFTEVTVFLCNNCIFYCLKWKTHLEHRFATGHSKPRQIKSYMCNRPGCVYRADSRDDMIQHNEQHTGWFQYFNQGILRINKRNNKYYIPFCR